MAIAFSVPALSIYLSTYEVSKRYLGARWLQADRKATLLEQLPVFMLSGVAAEGTFVALEVEKGADRGAVASGAVWTPLDVLKSRLVRSSLRLSLL